MQISAIIMAGGKGTRFDFKQVKSKYQEKLLLKVEKKFIIEHVINAVNASNKIDRVILAVSPYSKNTKNIVNKKYKSIEVIETPCRGFHADLKYIIKKLIIKTTLIISGDLPLIKPKIIDDIICKFYNLKKPALSVMARADLFKKYGLTPTMTFFHEKFQEELVPLGINIIDGNYIDQNEIDQVILKNENPRLLYNINTIDDFKQLKIYINKRNYINNI